MKRNNKKGFTIVELVIVIAVIAILAGVLIPTFAGIVEKANKNAALQEARAIMTNYVASIDYTEATPEESYNIAVEKDENTYYLFSVTNGEMNDTPEEVAKTAVPKNKLLVTADGDDTDGWPETTPAEKSGDDADAGEGETPDETPVENNGQ